MIFVEAMVGGKPLAAISQMPFPEDCRSVSRRLEQLGDRLFIRVEAHRTARTERTMDPQPHIVAASQQGAARRTTHRLRCIEICQPHSLASHRVEVRRNHLVASEAMKVGIAQIVGKKHYKIGLGFTRFP